MKKIVISGALLFALIACNSKQEQHLSNTESTAEKGVNESVSETVVLPDSLSVLKLAEEVVELIQKKDFKKLGEHFHPKNGVLFSPYAHVSKTEDVQLLNEQFVATENKKYNWGSQDGSGEPILLSVPEYMNQYVNRSNYLSESNLQVGYNQFIGAGNSLNNLRTVFSDNPVVEFYYPGTEKYSQMDWNALRLVFEKYENEFYLVAIVNDRWTI